MYPAKLQQRSLKTISNRVVSASRLTADCSSCWRRSLETAVVGQWKSKLGSQVKEVNTYRQHRMYTPKVGVYVLEHLNLILHELEELAGDFHPRPGNACSGMHEQVRIEKVEVCGFVSNVSLTCHEGESHTIGPNGRSREGRQTTAVTHRIRGDSGARDFAEPIHRLGWVLAPPPAPGA